MFILKFQVNLELQPSLLELHGQSHSFLCFFRINSSSSCVLAQFLNENEKTRKKSNNKRRRRKEKGKRNRCKAKPWAADRIIAHGLIY